MDSIAEYLIHANDVKVIFQVEFHLFAQTIWYLKNNIIRIKSIYKIVFTNIAM